MVWRRGRKPQRRAAPASCGGKRKFAQLGVNGAARAAAAEVQIERWSGEPPEIRRFQRTNGPLESAERDRLLNPGQREMRSIGPSFGSDPEFGQRFIGGAGQFGQRRRGLHARPEHARVVWIRKPA